MPEPVAYDLGSSKVSLGIHSSSPMDKLFVSHGGISSLCFDRNSFFDSNFNVDTFLSSHTQRGISLEVLKDDLATYRKILQSALVQLIDREYADFVHLSSSLVGVEKNIDNLRVPVVEDLKEIEKCATSLSDVITQLENKIQRRAVVQKEKRNLKSLLSCMGWLETLINVDRKLSSTKLGPGRLPHLYRASDVLRRLYLEEKNISATSWYISAREKLAFADTSVTRVLAEELISAVQKGDSIAAQNIFSLYEHLDRRTMAFHVISEDFIKPRLSSIIRDFQLRKRSLEELLSMLYVVIEEQFYSLIYIDDVHILLETLWKSLVFSLINEAQSYFIPDQASDFHRNFRASRAFLKKFVALFSSVRLAFGEMFWRHPSTALFQDKWSLSIYYQIRFMEIGSPLELAVSGELQLLESEKINLFKLNWTEVLWKSILRCWDCEVCLEELIHRFWKLTLLLISRYISSLKHVDWSSNKADFVPDVLADLTLLKSRLQTLPQCYVLPFLAENSHVNTASVEALLFASLNDSVNALEFVELQILETLGGKCGLEMRELMKQTQEIPRLYRRTNRESPTFASAFVDLAFDMLTEQMCRAKLSNAQRTEFLRTALEKTLKQYSGWVLDLLEAVRRMEDSLKKLRKARAVVDSSVGLSDDDKIREQLALDVLKVKERVHLLGCSPSAHPDLVTTEDRVLAERPVQETK